jgi:acyl dehydratase
MSTLTQHLGLLVGRRPGLRAGEALAEVRVTRELAWTREEMNAYRRVTGLVDDGRMPRLAPQVMAAGLHLDVLADKRFPFKALGLVHVENAVTVTRDVADTASLHLTAYVTHARPAPRGTLFDLVTEAADADGLLGTWTTTVLARGPSTEAPPSEKKPDAPLDGTLVASVTASAPEDIGRRYAAIAGDLNPIHQRALLAKAFGFPRAIAHGMWTLARTLAETREAIGDPRRFTARFRKPLFLPGRIVIEARRRDDGSATLTASPLKGGTAHLVVDVAAEKR